MDYLIQQLINAFALGGTYALLALGLAVIFSVLGLINFAHGELMTVTGYGLVFALGVGFGYMPAVICGILLAIVVAVSMERIAFRPVRRASATTMLLTSFAVSSILHTGFQNFISARPIAVPVPDWMGRSIAIGSMEIGIIPLISILTTAGSLALLVWFFQRSYFGLAMRAAAADFSIARLMGIKANQVIAAAFAISGLLASLAGLLWLFQRGSVDPMLGFVPVLKAFIAAVLGGLGSLEGAVLGGFILGFIEVMLRGYLPDPILGFRDAISLSMIVAILVFFPNGLLGRQIEAR